MSYTVYQPFAYSAEYTQIFCILFVIIFSGLYFFFANLVYLLLVLSITICYCYLLEACPEGKKYLVEFVHDKTPLRSGTVWQYEEIEMTK